MLPRRGEHCTGVTKNNNPWQEKKKKHTLKQQSSSKQFSLGAMTAASSGTLQGLWQRINKSLISCWWSHNALVTDHLFFAALKIPTGEQKESQLETSKAKKNILHGFDWWLHFLQGSNMSPSSFFLNGFLKTNVSCWLPTQMIKVNLCKNSVFVSYRMAGSQHRRPLMEMEAKVGLVLLVMFLQKWSRVWNANGVNGKAFVTLLCTEQVFKFQIFGMRENRLKTLSSKRSTCRSSVGLGGEWISLWLARHLFG